LTARLSLLFFLPLSFQRGPFLFPSSPYFSEEKFLVLREVENLTFFFPLQSCERTPFPLFSLARGGRSFASRKMKGSRVAISSPPLKVHARFFPSLRIGDLFPFLLRSEKLYRCASSGMMTLPFFSLVVLYFFSFPLPRSEYLSSPLLEDEARFTVEIVISPLSGFVRSRPELLETRII